MRKSYLLLLMLGGLTATSCSSGSDGDDESLTPPVATAEYISFAPTINALSRASETQFDQGDAIGVFAVKSSGSDNKGIIADNGNYADNVKYAYNGTKFTASGAGIEKPSDGTKVYYHAVYPYTSGAKNKFTFTVNSNQDSYANHTASDLLTASTAATGEQLVDLTFDHRLSMMIFNFEGEGWPAGDVSMTMKEVYTSVSVDLNTLSFTPTGTKGDIVCTGNGTKSFKVILPPQKFEKGSVIATINIGGESYSVTANDDAEVNSGKQNSFTLTINKDKEIVEFAGDINPWETEEDGEETPNIGSEQNIYGTWKLVCEEGYEEGESYVDTNPTQRYYNLKDNMQYTVYQKDRDNGTWSIKDSGTFIIDVDKAYLWMYGGEYKILTLNSNTLKLWVIWVGMRENEYQIQTLEKVSDDVLNNLGL